MERLTRAFLLLVAALLASASAWALPAPTTEYRAYSPDWAIGEGFGVTTAIACSAFASQTGGGYQVNCQNQSIRQLSTGNQKWVNYQTVKRCSAGLLDTAQTACVCPAGQKENVGGSACVPDVPASCVSNAERDASGNCVCKAGYEQTDGSNGPQCAKKCAFGDVGPMGWFDGGTSLSGGPPVAICNEGCTQTFQGSFPEGNVIQDGKKHYYARGGYMATGGRCEVGEQTPGLPDGKNELPSDTCGPGQEAGKVNGKTVCGTLGGEGAGDGSGGPKSDNKETTETSETIVTNPDGSTTKTTTSVVTGAGGGKTTTTTETTTSADGKNTNTKVTVEGDGVDSKGEGGSGGSGSGGGGNGNGNGDGGDDDDDNEDPEKEKCEKNSSEEGCGGTPAEVPGDLYTAKDKTFASVMEEAKTKLETSPLGSSVAGFFNVSGGGTCPVISGTIPWLNAEFKFDAYCSSQAADVFLALKAVLLVIATVAAIRIAIE